MSIARSTLVCALLLGATVHGQVAAPAPAPAPQQPPAPAAPAPGAQPPAPPAGTPVVPAPAVTNAPLGGRMFLGQTGVIFTPVRPERVVDFEMVIGFVQAALAKSTNPQVREQAKGWRMFKAVEPGPNGTVLYVFWMDPAVAGADYALGPILSDAFPDQVEQIWKLYQGALAGSQSLLNLVTVEPPPLPPVGTPIVPGTPEPVRPAPPTGVPPAETPPADTPPPANP
jgi:hypothetical protein